MVVFTDPIVAVDAKIASIVAINQTLTLQCTATIVRGITNAVDIIWTTDNTQIRRVNNVTASSHINSSSIYNDLFIIPSLNISDIGRVYECEVLVNSVLPSSAKTDIIIPIPSMRMHNIICMNTASTHNSNSINYIAIVVIFYLCFTTT